MHMSLIEDNMNNKVVEECLLYKTSGQDYIENPKKDEFAKMKELLLAQLDYIQQQADFLNSKDEDLNKLKIENETLKQRLHRMTRRVSLTKSPVSLKRNKNRKKDTKRRRSCSTNPDKKDKKNKKKDKRLDKEAQLNVSQALKARSEASIGPLSRRFSKLTLTSSAYYTSVGENETLNNLTCQTPKVTTLEVPKWTIKTYSSSSCVEGVENLSDEAFERRHFRLAIDEKRRKRWDVQRIREERRTEKLKERELKKIAKQEALNNPTPIQSFWPDPEEINDRLSLIVMEKIPVAIFGIPIPYSSECEPTLDWLNGKVQINAKTKRRKR